MADDPNFPESFTPETITPTEQTPNAVPVSGLPDHGAPEPNTQTYNPSTPLDRFTKARDDGYDWSTIDEHLANFRDRATQFGYTDSEVDAHLGYQDSSATFDHLAAGWAQTLSADPDIPQELLKPSEKFDSGTLWLSGNIRDDYVNALLNGSVKGPDDFADMEAKTVFHAMDTMTPGGTYDAKRDEILTNLQQLQQDLKAQLPDPRQLVDASLGVSDAANNDFDFGTLSNVQRNLLNNYAKTGEQPLTALQRAMSDPRLQATLTGSPYVEPPDLWGSVARVWQATKQGEYANWQDIVPDIKSGVADLGTEMDRLNRSGNPLGAAMMGVAGIAIGGFNGFKKAVGAFLLPQIAGMSQLISEFTGDPNTPQESVQSVPELLNMINAVGAEVGFMAPQFQGLRARIANTAVKDQAMIIANQLKDNSAALMADQFPKGMTPPHILDFGDDNLFRQARAHDMAPQPPMTGTVFAHEPTAIGPVSEEGVATKTQHRYEIRDQDGNVAASFDIVKEGTGATASNPPRVWFPGVTEVAKTFFRDNPDVDTISGFRGRSPTGMSLTRDQVMQRPAEALEALGATPHEVMQQTVQDALGRPATPQAFDTAVKAIADRTGTFFQSIMEKAGASPAGIKLAKAYDTASVLAGVFRNIMSDESGTLTIARPGAKSATITMALDDLLSRMGSNPARDVAERLFNQKFGLQDQMIQQNMRIMNQYASTVDKYKDEYERQIRLGPAGNLNSDPLHIMNRYIDGRGAWTLAPDHELTVVADALKNIHDDLWNQMTQRLGKQGAIDWFQNHYRYQFERPGSVAGMFTGPMKNAPTLSEGIERGLLPREVNPINARIAENFQLGRFMAQRDVVDTAKNLIMPNGFAAIRTLKQNELLPVGHTRLAGTQSLYAPDGFAQTYNRFFYKGYAQDMAGGTFYDKLMHFSNSLTGLKLAFPFYHAQAIMAEAAMTNIAIGLGRLARGELAQGLGRVAAGITVFPSVVQLARDGYKFQKTYFDKTMANDPLASAFAQARGRIAGRQTIYKYAGGASYLEKLTSQGVGPWWGDRVTQARNALLGLPGESKAEALGKMPFRVIGTGMSEAMKMFSLVTGSDFLFDKLIPWVKQGAYAGEMQMFLDQNPLASQAQKLDKANKIIDSMDNRFGELNQDRLFWNANLKKTLNIALISLGWEYGSLRAFANAGGLNIDHLMPRLEANPMAMRWLLAFGIGSSVVNNIYQYAKTGQPTWQTSSPVLDNFLARNGGTVTNSHITVPDRTILPGYLKDVFNAGKLFLTNPINDPIFGRLQNLEGLVQGKLNPMWQIAMMLATGKDSLGHVVRDIPVPNEHGVAHTPKTFGEVMENYLDHINTGMAPIAMETIGERKRGTGVSKLEDILGYRSGPTWLINPQGYQKSQQNMEKFLQREELGRAKAEQGQLEAPTETFGSTGRLGTGVSGVFGRQSSPFGKKKNSF